MWKRICHFPLKWLYLSIAGSLALNAALILSLKAGGLHKILQSPADTEWMGIPYALEPSHYNLYGWQVPAPDEIDEGTFAGAWVLPYRLDIPKVIFSTEEILADTEGRVTESFHIAENMSDRVRFWFEIYTKYDFEHRVVHHSRYPWVVFEVVDISEEMAGKGAKWYRIQKGEKRVQQRRAEIRRALLALPKKRSFQWTEQEKKWAQALSQLPGRSLETKARFAASRLRTQTGQKSQFREALVRAEEYFPAMAEIFEREGLPLELIRLPLVESSFNLQATSKVGASGVWQIMPQIGRRLMTLDNSIDERLSPLKSTQLAARLFKENHQILWRKWPLAVTAYNHGPGGVRTASRAAKSRDLGKIIQRYQSKRFSFASSNFYACFQAAVYAEAYKDHVFPGLLLKEPLNLQEIKLTRRMRPSQLKAQHQLSREEFVRLNPDLKKLSQSDGWLPRGLSVYVPAPGPLAQNEDAEPWGT